tara:strand:- start:159880 stop:160707 length:828 start_codon:yes stop_codon:yes gene_type:complete
LVSLVVAGLVFAFTGEAKVDSLHRSSKHRGSGIYIGGVKIGGDWFGSGDEPAADGTPAKHAVAQDEVPNVRHVSHSPSLNPWATEPAADDVPVVGNWPPSVGAFYPDLVLKDQNGERFQLSDLAGKVILLELAAIPCKGCQAYAGGNERGGFGGVAVQKGLGSIHQYAKQYARVDLETDPNVVFVQLLLYGKSMRNPTANEVSGWARHFGMNRSKNQIVLQGDRSMVTRESSNLIPGFHLIDRNFVLRFDASGHHPHDDLYRDLLPALGKLARQR